jgi:ABC-type multidrug transport system ATPase subunit
VLSRLKPSQVTVRGTGRLAASTDATSSTDGLVLAGVTKRWPGHDDPVLDDVSFDVPRGTAASLVGANGAGKTTLLRTIAGIIAPDQGKALLNGLDSESNGRSYRQRIGMVSAGNSGLFARLKVRRHLEYWTRLALMPRSESRDAVERTLDAFALRELASRRADRLSMGQRQRLRIALAFIHEPSLVLLDEARTSLDDQGLTILSHAVDGLVARGGAVLWCSPYGLEEGEDLDRRYVLRQGKVHRE